MTTPIYNTEDTIDSRDVIARIKELQSDLEIKEDETGKIKKELDTLISLEMEAENFAEDWEHGETIINKNYFTEYAKQTAKDITDISTIWPHCHIDWEAAAEALKVDYAEISFDGEPYYIR